MNYIYLQVDCRFNKWLLETIKDIPVIHYTLKKCQMISAQVVTGIFDCPENVKLIDILTEWGGVKVILSKEEDVNKRFVDIVTELDGNLVVRVGGDQLLIDTDKINDVLYEMESNGELDWYIEKSSMSVLPDIVRIRCIKEYRNKLMGASRYFDVLKSIPQVKRHKLPYSLMLPFNFRANSYCNFRVCKNVIENNLDIYEISGEALSEMAHPDSYFMKTGLLSSWIVPYENADFFYDEDNKINPWLGRTVIEVIKRHLNDTMKVFEWGMGNSTLFWSQYVNKVISVEHDKEWYTKMKEIAPPNADCRYVELEYGGDYCKEVLNTDTEFDIIMIDGRDRVRCALNSVDKLTADGVIIWDNSERDSYQPGFDYLKSKGFKQLELSGALYQYVRFACYTSIFYRENNILGL